MLLLGRRKGAIIGGKNPYKYLLWAILLNHWVSKHSMTQIINAGFTCTITSTLSNKLNKHNMAIWIYG